jgi:formylglycine-generating enzyme required for sulfatase activity
MWSTTNSSVHLSRRSLLSGAALLLARLDAMEESQVHGISELLEGNGMVRIPAGDFWMGSEDGNPDEQPVHRVRIQGFEMSKFETTQAQWETVMTDPHAKADAEHPRVPSHFKDPTLPVENVSWGDIQLFLKRLNARDTKHTYRLPSEAEWEYASRAGTTGDDPMGLVKTAWYKENSEERTHAAGELQPNEWGLYDMDGNVSEWVSDWYSPTYYAESPAADPRGPESGSYRVYRGGCWFDGSKYCRATLRRFDFPISRFYNVGFRLVRTPGR